MTSHAPDSPLSTRHDDVVRRFVVCPSCAMQASANDSRLLQPAAADPDLRRCRNCRAVIDLSTPSPKVARGLASV